MKIEYKAPLRLSLAGGGMDLPACYLKSGAHLLSVALTAAVSVTVGKEIEHESSSLNDLFKKKHPAYNVNTKSDVGSGAGLGGSGSTTVALVAASNYIENGEIGNSLDIGLEAYKWEREELSQPVGFQDQVVAAIGGCVEMIANTEGEINAYRRNDLTEGLNYLFENNFVLIETGIRRDANKLLRNLSKSYTQIEQDDSRPATVEDVEKSILAKDGEMFGEVLRRHWAAKCKRLPSASTDKIDFIINTAISAGANGAKAIGAGAGGFVLISGKKECKEEVVSALKAIGHDILKTSLSNQGVAKI